MENLYPLAEFNKKCATRLDELLAFAGSKTHLGRMLGVTPATVDGWIKRGKISKKAAIRVSANSYLCVEFSAEYLRPDLNWK